MPNLNVSYLGLPLEAPVVVGASGLTKDLDGIRACADAGAGAVVLKSIFEEQIRDDLHQFTESVESATYHPEAYDYFRADLAARYGARDYCKLIEQARKAVSIPVIASVNCYSSEAWTRFAEDIAEAGASALELNVSFPPLAQLYANPGDHIRSVAQIVHDVTKMVSIPVAVKLPPAGVYVAPLAAAMIEAGARGLVCFNRFFVPTVDLEAEALDEHPTYSVPEESNLPRRYIGLLYRRLAGDFAANTGVHSAEDALAQILVGAAVVQVVSTVYKNGFGRIGEIRDGIGAWMQRKGYKTLDAFRGKLAADPGDTANAFGRFQYIRTLTERLPQRP